MVDAGIVVVVVVVCDVAEAGGCIGIILLGCSKPTILSTSAIELLSLACDSFFNFLDFLAAFLPRNFLNSSRPPPFDDESNSLSNAGNGGGGDEITFVRF